MHGHSLLHDLAWIMLAASITALIFHKINLPTLLGYLAAGFLLGPHLGLWPAVVEIENVLELSELGVIFLMFYIGLEFDMSRLKKAFGPALAALTLQTLLMLFVGMEASRWLGLSTVDGWFLGGLLSISSSMVSVKLIREKGLGDLPHVNYTIGILVLEDMLAILLLVLLSGLALQGGMEIATAGKTILFIGIFIISVYFIGKLGSQRLINLLHHKGTTELVTLSTLGLIFAVSLFADALHFSWALGGFLAGAILSRSKLAHRIEELTEPIRDLFTAIFFVTVGMLIDPKSLLHNAGVILLLSAIVIVCKFCSCWLGIFVAGKGAKSAGRASLIKSQIGEFSFVITALGAKHGATSADLQSIVSGVAFVTILLTPALINNEHRILGTIARIAPKAFDEFCSLYSRWVETLSVSLSRSVFLKLAHKPAAMICIHFLLINAIIIAARVLSEKVPVPEFLPLSQPLFQQSLFVLSLLLSLPFFVDTMRNLNVLVWLVSETTLSRPAFQQFSKGIYRSAFNGLILLLLLFVYGSVFLIIAGPYFPTGAIFAAFVALSLLIGLIFWKKLVHMHNQWESAVLNAMQSETKERISQKISNSLERLKTQRPWNVKVEPVILDANSKWAGMEIKDINVRENTGALIAGIERSGFELGEVKPTTMLFPQDHVFLLGEPDQIAAAKAYLNQPAPSDQPQPEHFAFAREIVPPLCPWIDLSIAESRIRSEYQVTIVGIQKNDKRIIGPSPNEIIEEGDLLLAMGDRGNLDRFRDALHSNSS